MRLFISYSHEDKSAVERITTRLEAEGHEVWVDSVKLEPGDNLQLKLDEGLETAEALIVVVSRNSFRSQWVQYEYSAIALRQLSKRETRLIPVRLDHSEVPSYLSDRIYIDLSENFEAGLEQLVVGLRRLTPSALATPPARSARTVEDRSTQVNRLRECLRRGRLTLVCGAGVSVDAGIPTWGDLLVRLLGRMMVRISENHTLDVNSDAAVEFQRRHGSR